jgi:hypothetical protein
MVRMTHVVLEQLAAIELTAIELAGFELASAEPAPVELQHRWNEAKRLQRTSQITHKPA